MPVEIPLTRGFVAIVDDEDAEKVSQYKWRITLTSRSQYALATINTNVGRRGLFMHRLILFGGLETDGRFVDHINGDGLDNRRCNIRFSTVAQNGWNRVKPISTNKSGVTGVFWREERAAWVSTIIANGKRHYLGLYKNKDDAIASRVRAEKELYGEFAPVKSPI